MRPDDIPDLPEDLYRLDNWHGPLEWLVDAALVGASVAIAMRWPLLYPLAALTIGARQRALATLLHCGTHRSLARSAWLNRFLGTWCSGYLMFQTWGAYFHSHVRDHHGHFGKAADSDYAFQVRMGMYERVTPGGLLRGFLSYTRYLVVHRLWPSRQDRGELLPIALLWMVIVAVCGMQNVMLYWLLPMLLAQAPIGFLVEMAEHWPLMTHRHPLYQTRNRASSWIESWLFSNHHENYHVVHHLYPRLPNHAMEAADRYLRQCWPAYQSRQDVHGGIFLSSNGAAPLVKLLEQAIRQPHTS